jgi:hypothetical protein
MANKQEKWQEIANRGLQDKFDPDTRAKFDEAVKRGLITMPQAQSAQPQVAQHQQVQQPQQVAQELSPMQEEVRSNTDNLNYTNIPESTGLQAIKDMFTGNDRMTPEMEQGGMLNIVNKQGDTIGQTQAMVNDVSILGDAATQAKYEAATFTMTNANEKAAVAVKLNPDLEIRYNKDKKGEVYPLLTNTKTGESSMVMMPGLGADDVVNSLSTAGLFMINPLKKVKAVGEVAKKVGRIGTEVAKAGATQTAIEAKDAAVGGQFDAKEVGMAAGMGGAGAGAGKVVGGTYRNIKQLLSGKGDEKLLELVAQSEKAGVPLMTTDVFPPETAVQKGFQALSERIPFLGTSGMRTSQKKARIDAVESMLEDFSASVGDDYAPQIIKSLKKSNMDKMARASSLRESSETALNSAGSVPPTKAQLIITEELAREQGKQLPDKGVIEYLTTLQGALVPDGFSTIRETRSALQGKISEMYRGQNTQIGASGAPVFSKIVGALDEDLTDFARTSGNKEAYRDWRLGNKLFRDEYVKLKGGALKNILDKGEIEPEVIRSVLKESKSSQTLRLYANLTDAGRKNTQKLLLQDAYKQATSNATGEFSADTFATIMSKKDSVNKIFFRDQDRKVIDGMVNVLRSTKQASTASAVPLTGAQAGVLGGIGTGGYYLGIDPILTASVMSAAGIGSRAIESKPIRNILIKLAATPKESAGYTKLVTKLTQLAQPLVNKEQEQQK